MNRTLSCLFFSRRRFEPETLIFQLKSLASPNSDEQQHLVEALIGMERVAEHINEMQRIHEEYGAIFDHLFRQHQKASKQVRR